LIDQQIETEFKKMVYSL